MEEERGGWFVNGYLILDLLLSIAVLIAVAWAKREMEGYMSFGGFEALFWLLLLAPAFWGQQVAIPFIALTLWQRRRWMLVVACVLQMVCLLPPLAIYYLMEAVSWYSLLLAAQVIFAVVGLVVQHWVR